MAKSKKPLAEQYKSVSGSFRKKISEARKQGFDVNYKINKPEQLTQEFIDTLRSIKIADIKQGVNIDGISVESYYAGEMDLRPTKHTYIEEVEEYAVDEPTVNIEEPKHENTVEYRGWIVDADTGELIEPIKYKPKTDEEIVNQYVKEVKDIFDRNGLTEDVLKRMLEPEENADDVEGYRDIDTFEIIGKNDPSIYVRDAQDRIIYDRQGNPLIKQNLIPISARNMSAEDYEELVAKNIKGKYGFESSSMYATDANERVSEFSGWLDEMIDKYGAFNVRDTLAQAEDDGYKMDYDFFYNATEEDYSNTINALEAMLALNYEKANEYQLANSDYFENAEGGFNIDYKNG